MVTITDETTYGEEVRSPDFDKEIKVTFNTDIPAGLKRELVKLYEKLSKNEKGAEENLMRMLVKNYIKDWNLANADGEKFPIEYDVLVDKFPRNLSGWVMKQVTSFMTPDKN